MINIIGKRQRFLLLSGIMLLACIVFLGVFGLKPGVEFSSGTLLTVGFDEEVPRNELIQEVASLGYPTAVIQHTGEDYLIRLPELSDRAKTELQSGLEAKFGKLNVRGFDIVSPLVATETTRNAIIAVALSSIGILLYVWWAFRRMQNSLRYGACAIIALVHDVLVSMGVFAILGALLGWEINLMFVTGVLAVIGYSVNDTVVIFDRIRENSLRYPKMNFETIVNNSVVETLSRALNTSITTIFGILALLLFVGSTIQNFVVVLFIGVTAGTYSSICLSPSLLVMWKKHELGKLVPGGRSPVASRANG